MSVKLLPHNQEVYDKVMKALNTSRRTCVVQPTGTGKSYVIAAVSENYKHVLILAPNNFVLGQLDKVIRKHEGQEIDMMTYAGLNIATKVRGWYDLIVLDEFHRAGAQEWGEAVHGLLEINPTSKVLGTSATPIRYLDAGRDMTLELFGGNIASQMSIGEAWSKGILPVPVYVTGVFDFDKTVSYLSRQIKATNRLGNDEKNIRLTRLSNTMLDWQRSYGMVQIVKKYISKDVHRVLVFCSHVKGIRQTKATVEQWFCDAGLSVGDTYYVHSGLPDKTLERRMKAFESDASLQKGLKLMFSVNMLNEGVHIPDVEAVLLLRTTASRIIYMQQIGRCLTAANTGIKPTILDMVDNITTTTALHDLREDYAYWQKKRKHRNGDSDSLDFEVYDYLQELRQVIATLTDDIRHVVVSFDERLTRLTAYCETHGHLPISRHKSDFRNWLQIRATNATHPALVELEKKYPRDIDYDPQQVVDKLKLFVAENDRWPKRDSDNPSERKLAMQWYTRKDVLMKISDIGKAYGKYGRAKVTVEYRMGIVSDFCTKYHRLPLRGKDSEEEQNAAKHWGWLTQKGRSQEAEDFVNTTRRDYGKNRPDDDERFAFWEKYISNLGRLPVNGGKDKLESRWMAYKKRNADDPRVASLIEKYKDATESYRWGNKRKN